MARAAMLVLMLFLVAAPVAAEPRITVSPTGEVIEGRPVRVRFVGLRPGQAAVVHVSRMWDRYPAGQEPYRGRAAFAADRRGVIDLATASPLPGSSWDRPDPAGAFWSMQPARRVPDLVAQAAAVGSAAPDDLGPSEIRIELELAGRIAAATVVRIGPRPWLQTHEIREPEVTGFFARPLGFDRRPVVILLGGSEGGLFTARQIAPLLASHGYAVLGVGYFQGPETNLAGLRPNLELIPLEALDAARTWLIRMPGIQADRVAVVGISKGAEFGLVAATVFPWIDAVAAFAPSDLVWEGVPPDERPQQPAASSWTFSGQPLPYVRWSFAAALRGDAQREATGSSRLTDVHLASLAEYAPDVEAARIPIERSCAALFLAAGRDDAMWPSGPAVAALAARLKAAGYRRPVQTEIVDTGHLILGTGWAPTTTFQRETGMLQGGDARRDAGAQAYLWPRLLAFLDRSLKSPVAAGSDCRARQ